MTMEERLKRIPKSYDDFVKYTMECIDEDNSVKELIEQQFFTKPDSDVNDITKVLLEYRGIGNEPLEIVDDDETVKRPFKVAML